MNHASNMDVAVNLNLDSAYPIERCLLKILNISWVTFQGFGPGLLWL